jgi:hypothetical protein
LKGRGHGALGWGGGRLVRFITGQAGREAAGIYVLGAYQAASVFCLAP